MKMSTLVNVLLCGVLLVSVSGASSCGTPSNNTVDITILHTNDIHSHLRAEPALSERNPFNLGGLARLKTLIDRERAAKPNTVLLDAGDWSEATMYFYADAGANMLKLMDTMGYDAAVVGNHDFLNGPTQLASIIESAHPRFPVLGANKDLTPLPQPDRDRVAKDVVDYTILNAGGVKIGVIGILCNDFFYYSYFKPAVVTDVVSTASAIANKLHNQKLADVIVLLSHNSFNLNVSWAKQVPWVNAVISGHSHLKVPQAVEVSNGGRPAYIAETKAWGQYLGDMTLTVNKDTGQVTLKSYDLHPVTSDLPEDPSVAALVDAQDAALAAKFGHDVAHDHIADNTDEIVHADTREGPLPNMAADAYRAATGADIALESAELMGEDGIHPGPLSTMSIVNIMPHIYQPSTGKAWTLKKLSLSGASLRGLLNLTFIAEGINLLGWIAQSGAQITWQNNGLSSIQSIKILNPVTGAYEDLNDSATYVVAIHDGLLLAMGILVEKLHLDVDLSHIQETGIEAWQAIFNLIQARSVVRAADFEPGTRFHTLDADLGFYEHNVKVSPKTTGSGYVVSVQVQNEGLKTSDPAAFKLRVLRSQSNDLAHDATPGNESTPITGDVAIPALNPGDRTIVELPWDNLPGPGLYSLSIQLVGTDANPRNNQLILHTIIPSK